MAKQVPWRTWLAETSGHPEFLFGVENVLGEESSHSKLQKKTHTTKIFRKDD